MIKVYVVLCMVHYGISAVEGIFSTYEKAEKFLNAQTKSIWWDFIIQEHEIQ